MCIRDSYNTDLNKWGTLESKSLIIPIRKANNSYYAEDSFLKKDLEFLEQDIRHIKQKNPNWLYINRNDNISILIICLGANDMLRGINPDETRINLEKIIQIANKKKIKIILAGMLAPNSHGKIYKKKFDNVYPNLSEKYNLPLIPFLLKDVALKPDLNLNDGIHPNKKGTKIISITIKNKILENI